MATANTTVKKVLDHLLQNGGGNSKVVKEWHSGSNWYRQWQSGFIEQGGQVIPVTAYNYVVTLHTPFTTTGYSVLLTRQDPEPNGNSIPLVSKGTQTASQFKAHSLNGQVLFWRAEGY